MAKAGLSAGFSTLSNPYSYTAKDLSVAVPDIGATEAMQNAAASGAMMGNQVSQAFENLPGLLPMQQVPAAPAASQAASTLPLYNASTNEYAVAGQRIAADDATKLLQSESSIGQPAPPGTDLGPGFRPVTIESYQQMLAGIKDPSFGAMVGKGFEIGSQNLKTLYGSALQSVSGGEYGGGMVKSAGTELAKLQPYQRDVAEGITADWLATTIGQQGPMVLESALTAIAGAVVGSAAAGPGAGFLAGVAGIFGKKAVKEKILQAAAKYNTAKAAGVALNSTEELKQATKLLKQAGAVVGGAAASFAGNEVIAAGDIYSEGGSPVESWVKGVPYAALDLLPEAGAIKWAFFGGRRAALPRGATLGQRALEYGVKRVGGGGLLLGTAEGVTETAQEAIVLEAGGKDMTSPEALNRYLNSFAAGFAVGGLMGGLANLRSRPETKEETNLLDNSPAPGTQGDLFPDMPVQAGPPRPPPSGGGAAVQPVKPEVSPDQAGFDFGPQQQDLFPLEVSTPYGAQQTEDRRAGVAPSGTALGQRSLLEPTQLSLDLFQDELPPAPSLEWLTLLRPKRSPPPPPVANPAQGVLQFAEPAPVRGGVGNIGQLLLRERDYPLAQAQQEEQKAQDYPLAQAQQQLQLPTESEFRGYDAAGSTGLLPTIEARPTQATQLELPVVRQQARPTRAEKLKRGARPAAQIPEVVPATQKELEAAGQLRLFNEKGRPTINALRGAARKLLRGKPTVEVGATQIPATGKSVDLTVAARKRAKEAKREAQADVKKDVTLVSERRVKDATDTPIVELTLSDGSVRRIQRAVGSQTREGFTGWYDVDLLENPKPYQVAYIADTKQGAINRILADTNAAPTQGTPKAQEETKLEPTRSSITKSGAYLRPAKGEDSEASAGFRTIKADDDIALDAPDIVGATMITWIDAKVPGSGAGSKLLEDINSWADTNNKTLVVVPARGKLKNWYQRNGFEDRADYMVRTPTQGTPNAVQEQSTDEVSARGEPGTGEGVGPEVRRTEEPAGKGKLRRKGQEVTTEPVPEGQVAGQEETVKPRLRIKFSPRTKQYYIIFTDRQRPASESAFNTESEARAYAAVKYPDKTVEADVTGVTPTKKSEAALAAATEVPPSAKGVTIRVRVGKGTIPANADEVLAKVDSDIDRYSALLDCLRK